MYFGESRKDTVGSRSGSSGETEKVEGGRREFV